MEISHGGTVGHWLALLPHSQETLHGVCMSSIVCLSSFPVLYFLPQFKDVYFGASSRTDDSKLINLRSMNGE